MWRSVCRFQALHSIESPSDAIRALLELALRDSQPLDAAVMRAAWRTGIRGGVSKLREEMDRVIAKSLGLSDAEIAAATKG